MATLKVIFRRARTLLWTAMSIIIILAAVIVGIGKLLMPYSDRYQSRLESWLSEEFGRPVEVESFEGEWQAFGPRLSLKGLTLLPLQGVAPGEAAIESAALDIKPLNVLIPGRPLYNFRVIGADFQLLRKADGRFELSGFGVSDRGGDGNSSGLRELAKVGEVILQDSSLEYADEKLDIHIGLDSIQGRLHMEGDQFSTEVQARLYDTRSALVYGEVEATLLLQLGDDQKLESAAWQASARELMLAAFQGKLPANPFLPLTGWLNAELWGEWTGTEGHSIRGASDLQDARLINDYQDLALDHVNMRFNWNYEAKGHWRLDIVDLLYDDGNESWTAPHISMARKTSEDLGLWISADYLPLGVPLNLARDVMSVYGTAWPRFLPQRAAGHVDDLELALNSSWRLRLAQGSVKNASVFDWGRWPDLQGLDGEVVMQQGSGKISVRGSGVLLDWPRMFGEQLYFAVPGCELDLSWGPRWQVGFSACSLENEDVGIAGRVIISGDEGKPRVDVNAVLNRGKIGRLDSYWPQSIMSDKILGWLRRGLLGGDIVRGRFQIHGDMDNWPFRHGEGRFEAVAEVKDAELDYVSGWPLARQVNAVAHFESATMDIAGSVGDIGGVRVQTASARIADLKKPLLTVSYSAEAELPGLLGFLQQSPLQQQINTDLSRFEFSGAAGLQGDLVFPLGNAEGEISVEGKVQLQGDRFADPDTEISLEDISGELHYDHQGFSGIGLTTVFRGHPGQLDVLAGTDRAEKFRADLSGNFDVKDVIPDFLLEGYSALAQIEGSTNWLVSMIVAPKDKDSDSAPVLRVLSGLEGVELSLPAPLNKPAGDYWPLVLHYPITGVDSLLDVELLDRVTLRFDLAGDTDAPQSAVIRVGGGVPDLPPQGFIRIEGSSEELDLDGWLDVIIEGAQQGKGMGGLELETGTLAADRLVFLDRWFSDVRMGFNVVDTDVNATFTGEDIDGSVSYTQGASGMQSLSAEFERLALADPISSGLEMETDPADLPALHLYAKSFRYAGVEMGETRIEAYPTATGFHFEKVDAVSEQLNVTASGDWSLQDRQQRSDFHILMTSESLGDFLETMDISSSMQGGQTVVQFDAWWAGSPAAFALSRLNGAVEFSVVQGNITDASAGTGRLIGLLSIQSLPKRLSLDFRDVFDAGFSFDEASGSFIMENGRASTDDVILESSAANISITGSTDLVGQQYDQLLTVKPGVGNTLPVIGAITGGPVGAAAGLALQGLLHEQLGDATQVQYTISGSWDEPVFEPVIVKLPDEQEPADEDAS
jgi:uncharacterized protein (TIGR02099 family)